MSGAGLNVQELGEKCKLKKKTESAKVLHKKITACQQDSFVDMSTIGYLNEFRCEAGYQGSQIIHQEGLSTFGYKPYVDPDEGQKKTKKSRYTKTFEELRFNRTLTLDEIKSGLHGLKRTGDGYGFTFTSVRLSGRELEDASLVANFCNLRSIDISDNLIKSIRNLGAMPYLQTINASKNQIDTFLDMTPVPVALKEVDFSFNLITTIVNMKKFWSLTDINLSHNELTVIEGFSDLEFLQILNLSYNKIDTIVNLDCPNLLILYLNANCLKSVSGFLNCNNLRYINLNGNRISTLKGLRYMNELTELQIADNNIDDMGELENLKTILTLTRIRLDSNPISSLENWRLVLIHMLPQILWMDGQSLKAEELRTAENFFNPSFKKMSYVDHAAMVLDRACQAANRVFDEHCRTRPFPPVLLLVGTPKSQCHRMALLLKERFRNKVYLGGVHSTASTLEGCNPNSDIPISHESFKEMKNRGEFLATSQILGRVCGFATSQIARAAEKGALLVAAVPLTTAISLREWNLQPKLVLVLPSSPPEFPNDEERRETMKRSSQSKESNLDKGSQHSGEEEGEEEDAQIETTGGTEEPLKDRLVNFAEMLSVVPSLTKDLERMAYLEPQEPVELGAPTRSILKTPHFEMENLFTSTRTPEMESDESINDSETANYLKSADKVKHHKRSATFHGHHGDEVDLEKKLRRRLKSLGPGLERYSLSDSDDDDGGEDNEGILSFETQEGIDINASELTEIHTYDIAMMSGIEEIIPTTPNTLRNSAKPSMTSDHHIKTPEGSAQRNTTSRPRRLNRLASLLMLETDQRLDSSLNIADILMNLPSMEKVDPKLLQTVDLSTAKAQFHPDITQTGLDVVESSVVVAPLKKEERIQPRSTLIPPSFSILQDPSPLRAAPVGNQRFVDNYNLIVAKEGAKKTKELEASMRGERVKTSSDDAGVTPLTKDRTSRKIKPINSKKVAKSGSGKDESNHHTKEEDDIKKILANYDEDIGDDSHKKSHKCKHHHHKKCKPKKISQSIDPLVKSKKSGSNEPANDFQKSSGSKGRKGCGGKSHSKIKTLIGPSNAFDWRGRKIAEPEVDLPPNFDRDIKRGVFYDGEFSKFAPEKSIADFNASPMIMDKQDHKPFDDSNTVAGISNALEFLGDNDNDEVLGIQEGRVGLATSIKEKNNQKKGLRFEESEEIRSSGGQIEKTTGVDTENAIQTQELDPNLPMESKVPEVQKVKEPVNMVESERSITDDHENHHLRYTDAMKSSIMQTREEYAEFNWDNPGFFHIVLDTSDLCTSYPILENLAMELLLKYKKESKVKDFLKASVKSHAGVNQTDEKWFLAERIKHFKNCASVWSKGYDSVNASVDRGKDNDEVAKPCEIYFDKASCPKGLLDSTLPRPGITLKMKRIVELHEKKIRCSKKYY